MKENIIIIKTQSLKRMILFTEIYDIVKRFHFKTFFRMYKSLNETKNDDRVDQSSISVGSDLFQNHMMK